MRYIFLKDQFENEGEFSYFHPTANYNEKKELRKGRKNFANSSMPSFIRTPYHHHRRFLSFLAATNPLRSRFSAAGSVVAAFPITHFSGYKFHCFSTTNLNPNINHHHHHHKLHRQDTRYLDMEPDMINSVSAAAGGGSGSEDYVHVDDVKAASADVSYSEEESVVEGEKRDDEGDEASSATGDGELGDGEKRELPEELARSVLKLTCESAAEGGVCDVYLVGTAHVSTV